MHTLRSDWNIILAVARKDIMDGVRNRLVWSLMLSLTLIMFMPLLIDWMIDPPYTSVVLYDPDDTRVAMELAQSQFFRVRKSPSLEELKEIVAAPGLQTAVQVGLIVNADLDLCIEQNSVCTIEGYLARTNRYQLESIQTQVAAQLQQVLGGQIFLQMENNLLVPKSSGAMLSGLMVMMVVVVLMAMGVQLIPHLLYEERQEGTMDALLLSPARAGQIVCGKALAGAFYVFLAALEIFLFYWRSVVHWEVAGLAVLLCVAFTVALGLLLGSWFQSARDGLGGSVLLLALLLGSMLLDSSAAATAGVARQITRWTPGVVLRDMIQASFMEQVPWKELLLPGLSILLLSLILFILVAWKIKQEQGGE